MLANFKGKKDVLPFVVEILNVFFFFLLLILLRDISTVRWVTYHRLCHPCNRKYHFIT